MQVPELLTLFPVIAMSDSKTNQAMDEDRIDEYDAILRALPEGVLLSINNSTSSSLPTDELRVDHSKPTETHVNLSAGEEYYRIYRDRRGDIVYGKVTGDGLSYEDEVITFEIIGIE